MSNVVIKNTKKYGRGLYATRNFKKGEIIEVSPVVVIDKMDTRLISDTNMNMYVFEWSKDSSALALGYGSLFNHSKKYNVSYMNSFRSKEIVFMTTRKIRKGEQLFIHYGYDPKYGIQITKQNKERRLSLFKDKLVRNDRKLLGELLEEEDKEKKEVFLARDSAPDAPPLFLEKNE